MPLYSYKCEACGLLFDRFSTIASRNEQACECGAPLDRTFTPTAVISDEIQGGFVQEHFGHTPETFYSKREMARRAKELGLQPMVRHIGEPGSDRSKHTSRWV